MSQKVKQANKVLLAFTDLPATEQALEPWSCPEVGYTLLGVGSINSEYRQT